MPISATLSRKLFETFGDEAAEHMVEWMNRIDSARTELRDLNEANASRIDGRFDQIEGQFAKIDGRFAEIDGRFAEIDGHFAKIDGRFAEIDGHFAKIDGRFTKLEGHVDARSTQLESAIARLEIKIEQRTADLMKWSFMFWLGAVAAIAILAGVLN